MVMQGFFSHTIRLFVVIAALGWANAHALIVNPWGFAMRLEGGGAVTNNWEIDGGLKSVDQGYGFDGRFEGVLEYRALRSGAPGYGVFYFGPYFNWQRELNTNTTSTFSTREETVGANEVGYRTVVRRINDETYDTYVVGLTLGGGYKYHTGRDTSFSARFGVSGGACFSTINRNNKYTAISTVTGSDNPIGTEPDGAGGTVIPALEATVTGDTGTDWGFCGDVTLGFGGGYGAFDYGIAFHLLTSYLFEPGSSSVAASTNETNIENNGTATVPEYALNVVTGRSLSSLGIDSTINIYVGFSF